MLRATRNNTFCDTLALQEKSSYEKIHTKYCKTVLGLKKTACNISTLSELGRLPIASFIKTQVMMYFVRINTNNINPLIKESLNVNKSLHDEGFYTWYTLALNAFQEFDLDAEDFSNMDKCFHKIKVPFKKEFKKVVHNNYIQKTKDKLSKLTDNSQLYLYNKIKHDIVLEEYLIKEKNFKNRQLIAEFRTSDHCLQIETGRYINIPHQQRLCTTCNILEDEYHFFLNCHLNQQPRNLLINTIENKCPSFTNMSPMNRLDYILNPTSDLLSVVCTFIKQLLDLR